MLAVPTVAWLERAALGTRLSAARHACGWVVVLGASVYARDDLVYDGSAASGYVWALANLVACILHELHGDAPLPVAFPAPR